MITLWWYSDRLAIALQDIPLFCISVISRLSSIDNLRLANTEFQNYMLTCVRYNRRYCGLKLQQNWRPTWQLRGMCFSWRKKSRLKIKLFELNLKVSILNVLVLANWWTASHLKKKRPAPQMEVKHCCSRYEKRKKLSWKLK